MSILDTARRVMGRPQKPGCTCDECETARDIDRCMNAIIRAHETPEATAGTFTGEPFPANAAQLYNAGRAEVLRRLEDAE